MTPALSTTAWVLHDLGLATGFGGALFGRTALQPASRDIASREQRARVVEHAWKDFSVLNIASLATVGITWFAGRMWFSGGEIDRASRGFVIAKDILVGTALATGIGSVATGFALSREHEAHPETVLTGISETGEHGKRAHSLSIASNVLGLVSLCAIGGVIGVTAILAQKAGTSHKWSLLSRWLP